VAARSRRGFFLVSVVLFVAVVGVVAYLAWRQSVPRVRVASPPPRLVGQKTPLTVVVEAARGHVAHAEIRVVQDGKSSVVGVRSGRLGLQAEVAVTVDSSGLRLHEGPATLEVWARDDFWRPWRLGDKPSATFPITVDLTPPKLEILAVTTYLYQGGAGLVAFRVSEAARATVSVGPAVVPSFPIGPPERGGRVALIPLFHDIAPATPITIAAQDEAGNAVTSGVAAEVRPRRFPKDTIEIRDAFLQAKVPELLPQPPAGQSLVDSFLVINRDQRKQAELTKRELGAKTAATPLWEGAFVQPRNTKVFSNFAETRTYVHNGRTIDTQVHFGFDLASTKQSPVPAANKGVVAFAAPLTIYGNTVIVDHGLGLQTLYAHLSSIGVKVGDAVGKGQELGRSGATGLAIGDHLHYEVLLHGFSVTPVEWWDAKWIRDRIAKPLRDAGLPVIAGTEAGDEAPVPAASPRPARRRPR
jgi:murein DD-endopeptidase MepM/ murein hydrolase activator NlpD